MRIHFTEVRLSMVLGGGGGGSAIDRLIKVHSPGLSPRKCKTSTVIEL